jgi:hypothetical protein
VVDVERDEPTPAEQPGRSQLGERRHERRRVRAGGEGDEDPLLRREEAATPHGREYRRCVSMEPR